MSDTRLATALLEFGANVGALRQRAETAEAECSHLGAEVERLRSEVLIEAARLHDVILKEHSAQLATARQHVEALLRELRMAGSWESEGGVISVPPTEAEVSAEKWLEETR